MKKRFIILVLSVSLLFLNSCVHGGRTLYDDTSQKADARFEKVLQAVKDHDKVALRAMFSEQALNETEDFEEQMNYLFGFIKGDIQSWESNVSGGLDGSYSHGQRMSKVRSWYTVKTDKEEYLFFMYEFTEDTEHPENVGLYMLQVIKAEDRAMQFDGGQDILMPGIYRPDRNVEVLDNIAGEDIDGFFDMTKEAIVKLFGRTYEVVGAGAEGSYEGYYYKKYGLTFVFQYNDIVIGIDADDKFDINGARAGMDFAQIQACLGKAEIVETWMEEPNNIVYKIEYFIGKSKYSFYSLEPSGVNSELDITKGD